MQLSLDAGAITVAILVHMVGYGFILKDIGKKLEKSAEQLDRLIISTERAQAREEARAQFAIERRRKE